MSTPRNVSLRLLFSLMKSSNPVSILGLIFSSVSLFILLPGVLVLSTGSKAPYEKYDFEQIQQSGIEQNAKITSIDTVYNLRYNDENPKIINYEYVNKGRLVLDKFQTIDPNIQSVIGDGTQIIILVKGNESIVKGLEPFSFPYGIFFLLPVLFFLIGLFFLLIGLIPALKVFNLYKTGIIRDACVISANTGGSFPMSIFKRSVTVHYYYNNSFNERVFGEATTSDMLFLNELTAGSTVKIFVSEKNEKVSCLVSRYEAMKYNWL